MEKNISEKIEDLIKKKSIDNTQTNDFVRANEDYEKLIQEGLTMKRGFNLMTTEEIYNQGLNCSFTQNTQILYI